MQQAPIDRGKRSPCTGSFATPPPPPHAPGAATAALGGGDPLLSLSVLEPLAPSRQPEHPPTSAARIARAPQPRERRRMPGPLPHRRRSHLLQTVAIVAALPV